jgi:flagellar protein FliS
MNAKSAINAYKDMSLEAGVNGADPHKLVSMLFQGALLAIAKAKHEMLQKQTAAKGKSISKAISIIGEGLNASLNKSAGGELAQQLSALYDYMVGRLFTANLENDPAALDEVARLLADLSSAWDSMRPEAVRATGKHERDSKVQRRYAQA